MLRIRSIIPLSSEGFFKKISGKNWWPSSGNELKYLEIGWDPLGLSGRKALLVEATLKCKSGKITIQPQQPSCYSFPQGTTIAGKAKYPGTRKKHHNMHNSLLTELNDHLSVCEEAYKLVQEENTILHSPTPRDAYAHAGRRKELLERVTGSMVRVKAHKALWEKLTPNERAKSMDISNLIKQNMDLIMKTVMLDRDERKN